MRDPATTVGDDGTLHVPANELAALGVYPGDRVLRVGRRRIRPMPGARDIGFTDEHLRELRREMGEDLGEGLAR